jgi:hypothetical protein
VKTSVNSRLYCLCLFPRRKGTQSKALRRAERRIDELSAIILELEQRLQQFEEDSSQN